MSSPTITPGGYTGGSVWNQVQAEQSRGGSAPSNTGSNAVAIAPAAIQAGATIGGAAMSGKAGQKAAEMQLQANREALAFSRQQEAQRKTIYDQKMNQYTNMRNTLAQRYGITLANDAPAKEYTYGSELANTKSPTPLSPEDAFAKYMKEWKTYNPDASENDYNREAYGMWLNEFKPKPPTVPAVPAPGTTVGGLIQA